MFAVLTCVAFMAFVAWYSWYKTRGTIETSAGYFLAGIHCRLSTFNQYFNRTISRTKRLSLFRQYDSAGLGSLGHKRNYPFSHFIPPYVLRRSLLHYSGIFKESLRRRNKKNHRLSFHVRLHFRLVAYRIVRRSFGFDENS